MPETVIHSVLLFDGITVHPNAAINFDRMTGRITSVTNVLDEHVIYPPSTTVIDGRGHTLLPGLIESHVHVHGMHMKQGIEAPDPLLSPLRCGITTICDMHCDPGIVRSLKARIAEDVVQAKENNDTVKFSDLKSSLYSATIKGGWPKSVVLSHGPSKELEAFVDTWPSVTVENAGEFIKNHKQNEADYIKLMQENHCALVLPTNSIPVATLELQTAVVKEAHEAGLVAAGHAFSVDMTEIILKSGADGLTHTFFDQTPPQSILDLYKQTNAFLIPTLSLIASATKELQEWREKFADIGGRKGLIDGFSVQTMKQTVGMAAPSAKFQYAVDSVRMLKENGIDILAGTDSAVGLEGLAIGPSLWMEMFIYVEKCGFKVTDVLSSATSIPARRLGFHDRGVIAEGKRADLLLVKGDLTENLKHLWEGEGIVGVWKQGLKATQIHT